MNKYKEAREKLSDSQKSAMDKEYQQKKAEGKDSFVSKITGLSYAVAADPKPTTKKPESSASDFINSMIGPKEFKKISFERPKGMVYPEAAEAKVEPLKRPVPAIERDNTKVAKDIQTPTKAVKGSEDYYTRNNLHEKSSQLSNFLYGDRGNSNGLIPENIQALGSKLLTNSYKRDDNTFDKESKAIIYKVGENAQKRTGKLSTGTEYEDYKGAVSDEEYKQIEQLKKGDVNPIKGAINSKTSRGYNLASSLGRFSVAGDGNGKQIVTDDYNFTNNFTNDKDGNLKKDYMSNGNSLREVVANYAKSPMKSAYRDLRRVLAERDNKLTKKELENLKTSIALTPKDTVGFSKTPKGSIALD